MCKYFAVKYRDNLFLIGLINIYTPLGHKVNAYDRERGICDIIKYRHKLDLEQVKKSLKMYVQVMIKVIYLVILNK